MSGSTVAKPPISTHILDTTRGQPAAGVGVMNYIFYGFPLIHPNFIWNDSSFFPIFRWHYINSSTATGCWSTNRSQTRMDVAPNSYNVMHFEVDVINCYLLLRNISNPFERLQFIHWLRFGLSLKSICISFFLIVNFEHPPSTRLLSTVSKKLATITYRCCWIRLATQPIVDLNIAAFL